jgi:hypothetical protein
VATLSLDARAGYDPDDIFGVRRALVALPPARRDEFFDRWVALTEECGLEVSRIHAAVRLEIANAQGLDGAGAQGLDGAGAQGLDGAWSTVAQAMSAYLAWRAARTAR